MKNVKALSFTKSLIIALFLILLVFLNQYLHLKKWSDIYEVLWFCNAAAIGTAIAFLIHSRTLMSSVLIAATAAQAKWIYDFILYIFLSKSDGRTLLYFDADDMGYIIPGISVLLHFVLIPLTIYGVYKIGYSLWGIVVCLSIWVFGLLPASFYFTPSDENINCVFYPCDISYQEALRSINMNEHFRNDLKLWATTALINGVVLWFIFTFIIKRKKR